MSSYIIVECISNGLGTLPRNQTFKLSVHVVQGIVESSVLYLTGHYTLIWPIKA